MTVLFTTHPQFLAHDTGPFHPERPARLEAVGAFSILVVPVERMLR